MTRLVLVFFVVFSAFAQQRAVKRQATDIGPLPDSAPLTGLTLTLKPTAERSAALATLLREQQDPSSPNYHRWLTPEEFGDRFGATGDQSAQVSRWLSTQGLRVTGLARTRMFVSFDGSAGTVSRAFRTTLRSYRAGTERHFANSTEIALPASLSGVAGAVLGLDDFGWRPLATSASGTHTLTPDDIATIYNLKSLRDTGIDGRGQKIVLLGQTNIDPADLAAFRSRFNLPGTTPQIILSALGGDPGTRPDSVSEANIDLEWSGAVAPGASLVYVYSTGALSAALYAIDQKLGQIISSSYGICESEEVGVLPTFQQFVQAANALGITWLNATGDLGAAGCEGQAAVTAQNGLRVIFPASVPEVTAVGGTQFNEGTGNYWSPTNNANGGSALAYIPEVAWNDTLLRNSLAATGGGRSIFYSRPPWQTGLGVPNDSFRHIPDISFAASPQHDGYMTISGGKTSIYGGTSVSTPVFAGMVAMLNQFLSSSGAGNLNPTLYRMAQNTTGVFHDITQGDNIVPCLPGTPDCITGTMGYAAGPGYDEVTGLGSLDANNFIRQFGQNPGNGSLVTISVDPTPIYQTFPDSNGFTFTFNIALKEQNGRSTTLTGLNVGNVDYTAQIRNFFGTTNIPANGFLFAGLGVKNYTVPTDLVIAITGIDPGGRLWSQQTTVKLLGIQNKPAITGLTNAADFLPTYSPGMILSIFGSGLSTGSQAAGLTPLLSFMAGASVSINGYAAPLYFVSPTQLNVQIPYETALGTGTLTVFSGGQTVKSSINIVAAGPGIFTAGDKSLVPYNSGAPGQTVLAFITGEGAVTPTLATGETPAPGTPLARLPKPVLPVTVTVGGVPATVLFAGIPTGLVGATQINFVIPTGLPTGVQPVVVKVGTVASPPATILITPPAI